MFNQFLHGAITVCLLLGGLFFLRYWKKTRDRLFAIFAISFWVLAVERVLLAMTRPEDEFRWYIYLVRLFAFLLIIIAIIDKNRSKTS
jgi:uncharacterized protein DUF5985